MTPLEQLLQQLAGPSTAEAVGSMGDDDLARAAFEQQFGGALTYSKHTGWRFFPEGAHSWVTDRDGFEVTRIVQSMLRAQRAYENDAKASQALASRSKRDNVVAMLRHLEGVAYGGEWDTEEDLIAAPNGVIDLRTGKLIEGSPGQRITRKVNVPFDADATCPRWDKFLAEVFAGQPELTAYVQRLIGYGITGSNREQCFAVLFGEGSNGKSVFLTALRGILGEHAATVPFDMFTTSAKARGGPETEMLVGARLALASETNRSAVLDSAAIKNATGGEAITVNPKYRDPYSFVPQALILLATNYKPLVREQDNGTWRRIKLLPFAQRFEGADKDMDLDSKLRAEYPGILAWMVRGAVEWFARGLEDPQCVADALAEYREDSDALAGFYPGVLMDAPGQWTASADIWQAYETWADGEGDRAFKMSSTLVKAIAERSKGAARALRKKRGRGMVGVALASDNKRPIGPGIFSRGDG